MAWEFDRDPKIPPGISTDFVLGSADWSPKELREALRTQPQRMVILERHEQFASTPFHYLYPYPLLVALLDSLELSEDNFLRALDVLKPMLARIGKPLEWNAGDFDLKEVEIRDLLSLHEGRSDPKVGIEDVLAAESEVIPGVVIGTQGIAGFIAPKFWDDDEFLRELSRVVARHAEPPEEVMVEVRSGETSVSSPEAASEAVALSPSTPPVPPARFLHAQTNDRVSLNEEFAVAVRVSTGVASGAGSGSTPFDSGEKRIAGKVSIDLYAPGFKILDGASKTLNVPETGDSDPIRFGLHATRPGVHKIQISAWYSSAYIGAIDLNIAVAQASVNNGTALADVDLRDPQEGEYTLEIEYDAEERRYCFRLRGDNTTFEPVLGDKLEGMAQEVYEGIIRDLNAQARNLYKREPQEILLWLQGMGGDMFRTLIPRDVKESLWKNADRIKRLNILSRNDNLPWEVLYVLPENGQKGRFLVDGATVCRWVYGRRAPITVSKRVPCYVLPAGAPTSAQDEYVRIQTHLGAGNTIADTKALTLLLRSGGFGVLHFMAHNNSVNKPQAKPYIPFGGGKQFDLTYMGTIPDNKYLQDSPLVFMNACTSAGSKPLYTEMGGWASRFLQCGAGAYVGALWEIRDKPAGSFAAEFYAELVSGKNLGEAMAAGREAIPPGDPTRLAYTLYGNPLAKLA